MKRFITEQQHPKSCGATAIANVLKWLGYSASYRETMKDLERAGFEPQKGKWQHEMNAMLKAYDIKYKLHKKSTVANMKKIVGNGNALIFAYDWVTEDNTGGHFIFIDFNSMGYFNAYNYRKGFETGMVSELYIQQAILISKHYRKNAKKGRKGAYVWEIISE